jgi:hypothetical protein
MAWIVYFPLIYVLVDFYGEAQALFGLVLVALAYVLWLRREAATEQQPARVI